MEQIYYMTCRKRDAKTGLARPMGHSVTLSFEGQKMYKIYSASEQDKSAGMLREEGSPHASDALNCPLNNMQKNHLLLE